MGVVDSAELSERLTRYCVESGVVGAAVAVSIDGQLLRASHGVLSRRRPTPVTDETKFRIGSIGKVYTATLLLELLAERSIPPETRVTTLLPGFSLAYGAEAALTVTHLLSHTAGIAGDLRYQGYGDGVDAIGRYVAGLRDLGTIFPAGSSWGYSNSGYVVAGALVERLAGAPFAQVMAEFLTRLDLAETEFAPQVPPAGAANGHYSERDAELREAAPDAAADLGSFAPAGSMAFATAADVVKFAMGHVTPGLIDGRVTAAMREPVIECPPYGGAEPTHQGLGWKIYDWPSGTIVGHNGGSVGQGAFLRLLPARRIAVALVGNTAPATAFAWARWNFWLSKQLDVAEPARPSAAGPVPVEEMPRYAGTYEMRDVRFTIVEEAGRLRLQFAAFDSPPTTSWLSKLDEDRLTTSTGEVVTFESSGSCHLLHQGPYTARRTS